MTSLTVKVCFFAILCTVVGVVIKHIRPEFSPFVRIAGSVAVSVLALSIILPIITYLRSLFDGVSFGEYGGIVVKALGIAALTQICADICTSYRTFVRIEFCVVDLKSRLEFRIEG